MAKRRQPAALRRYWATHRKKGRKNAPKRRRHHRRARRNWMQSGAMVPVNPKRRRHHRRHRMNPHRRRHRRNPEFGGFYMPPVRTIAFGALGFASPPLVSGFLTSMAPSVMQVATNAGLIGKYAVKIGTIAITSWLVRRFVSQADGNSVAIGGGINIGMSLMYDFAPGLLPANPLSAYVPVRPGLRAYIPTRPGLRAVAPMRGGPLAGKGVFTPGVVGGSGYGADASTTAVERYRRY